MYDSVCLQIPLPGARAVLTQLPKDGAPTDCFGVLDIPRSISNLIAARLRSVSIFTQKALYPRIEVGPWLAEELDLELSRDAPVKVMPVGEGSRLGSVMVPRQSEERPVAGSNPTLVDQGEGVN